MTTPKTPDLYPNQKLQSTPPAQVSADRNECLSRADQYVQEPNRKREMVKQGLKGGAVGAGTGALAGAITGDAGQGTGAGAAVGGTLGLLKGGAELNERSDSYKRFVENCLQKKGYEIIGWSSKA